MNCRCAVLIMLLLASAISISGCAAADRGGFDGMRAERLDAVYDAARKALEQSELSITKSTKDATSALVVARDSQDTKYTVKLRAMAEGPTAISIHYGPWGSHTKSRPIYDKIIENLERQRQ